MTLKQLEAFYWAATCSSFAVAAQRVHLSFSSLSKRIADLEASLGETLFDRTGHRATLTDAGNALLPRAHELLRAADSIRLAVGGRTGLRGTCRFGTGELTAMTWLPKLMRAAQDEHPELSLEPHVDIGAVLERRVEAGELDFAIVAGRTSRSALASRPIAETRFVWCAAPRVAGKSRTLTPTLLAQWPLVISPAGAGTTRLCEDWLDAHAVDSPRRITCNHWGALAGLLIEGTGIGLLPQGWAHALQKRGLLRQLKSGETPASLQYSFHWRRDDSRPLIRYMRNLALSSVDFSASVLF